MIEKTILDYLEEQLTPVPVLMELPEVPSADYPTFPDALVVIEKVGTSRTNRVECASIAFQSYANTLYNAAALDDLVKAAVDKMATLTNICGVYLASNYNHTDTRTKRYRYQCVYDIYFIQEEITNVQHSD